jgi:putative SOS response-associated peptidase YedK
MCGRYSITSPTEAIQRVFGFVERPNLQPRYNVAPTQDVPIVRRAAADGGDDGARHLAVVRWGLVPFWAKDLSIGARMINARAESVAEKPAFREAFRCRRCLVVADGFYEWQKAGGAKQPYRITLADESPFGFAGLWESWRDKASGETVETCTIITTTANAALASIHERMPVILAPRDHEAWLATEPEEAATLADLLQPYPGEGVRAYPVSTRVNAVRNDDEACIAPLAG